MKNLRPSAGLRLLPLIAILGLGAASVTAHAATMLNQIKITSGSVTSTCSLNGFTVSAGGVSATVASCNPALSSDNSGGGNDNSGGGNDNSGGGNDNSGGGNDNSGGGNGNSGGGNGNSGGGVGGADPGTGSWSPDLKASPRVVVVNQAGGAADTLTVVPGCVNGGDASLGAGCTRQSVYNTTIGGESVAVRLTAGQILSIRYPISGKAGTGSTGVLRLANAVGGNIGVNTKVSLSTIPGDMTGGGQRRCIDEGNTTPGIATGTTKYECQIDRKAAMYYLNIAVQQECSGSSCIFYVGESSSEFR